ncbi:hypothetical protein K6119_06950 [Paracrocinitomix mangrovi]|uniref:hypothetical protein n=1 Tax=Paracrocinitomix mangrovi TaxID=2862509 RepID=UPI001C8D3160|nr:hypothetical protein [Paracrocinitomix mangrovi]UKN03251.1 hypothetical protein K6119_06950 [Paracrocinitomix mangrovi]
MKKLFLLLLFSSVVTGAFSQGCLQAWKDAFKKRGAYTVADDMHRKVYIHFADGEDSYCVEGKARVENGKIQSVFLQFEDGTYELMDMKITNLAGNQAGIENGISEEMINEKGEHFFVIFVEKLKPKKKEYKTVGGPGDL